jgi:hypothetical protein
MAYPDCNNNFLVRHDLVGSLDALEADRRREALQHVLLRDRNGPQFHV